MHSKSFSGHYDDAMLVVIRITRGVYIKEKLSNDCFTMHMVLTLSNYDWTCLIWSAM